MELSEYVSKAGRAAVSLVARPQDIPQYLKTFPLWSQASPLSLGLPWLTYGAIDRLQEFLTPAAQVLEWGAGGSTLFFAERVARVYSKESAPEWGKLLEPKVKDRKNVTLELAELPRDEEGGLQPKQFLAVPDEPFTVFLVDGQIYDSFGTYVSKWEGQELPIREVCFRIAETKVPDGGLIILDDSQWYPQILQLNNAKRVERCFGCTPCNYGAKETTLFFY